MPRVCAWFVRIAEAMTALWWVPTGHRPTVAEAGQRLRRPRAEGPTPYAFTLRTSFAAAVRDGQPSVRRPLRQTAREGDGSRSR